MADVISLVAYRPKMRRERAKDTWFGRAPQQIFAEDLKEAGFDLGEIEDFLFYFEWEFVQSLLEGEKPRIRVPAESRRVSLE